MSKNRNPNYFDQQKDFGNWRDICKPPITFSELLTKIIVTKTAPTGFVKSLEGYELAAQVVAK